MRLSERYPERRTFVTGAASGFGLALCTALAREGWTVGMADVDAARLDEAAAAVEAAGGRVDPVVLDVRDAAAFDAAASGYCARHGGVDLVVNNAGIGAGGFIDETTADEWRAVVDVDLLGVAHGCRAFAPVLVRQRRGHLVNVASAAAVACSPGMVAYNTAKAGVLALSETLWAELHGDGVDVSVVMPWFFRTRIAETALGPEGARSLTHRLVERSGITADDVAAHVLAALGRRRLYVTYPRRIGWLRLWRRLAPMTFRRWMARQAPKVRRATTPREAAS